MSTQEGKIIRRSSDVVSEALSTIHKYQEGEILPARCCYDYINKALMGGFRPQRVVAIGGRTGTGKNYVAQKILESILDKKLNPQADDYILLRCEFEMTPLDLLLRRISRELGRSIEDIINSKQTEDDERRIEAIAQSESSPNIFYIPKPCTIDEFILNVRKFLDYFVNKKLVFVLIDHIALIKRVGGDAKKSIDTLLASVNDMKLNYKNVVFMVLTQFNRGIEDREDPKVQAPRLSDVYQSDELAQLCEMVIGLHNPISLGIDKYMLFNPARYTTFERFKTDKRNQFQTEGLIFHHILKLRMKNMFDKEHPLDDLYVECKKGYLDLYPEKQEMTYSKKPNDNKNKKVEPEEKDIEEVDDNTFTSPAEDCPF